MFRELTLNTENEAMRADIFAMEGHLVKSTFSFPSLLVHADPDEGPGTENLPL